MSQLQLAAQVQSSVLDKSLGVAEEQGAAVVDMLQSSSPLDQGQQVADPDLGQRINLLA